METITEEVKTLVLTRVPPGDKWTSAIKTSPVFESLTEGLEYVFQQTKCTTYYISSFEGKVFSVTSTEVELPPPPPPTRYSLYGED